MRSLLLIIALATSMLANESEVTVAPHSYSVKDNLKDKLSWKLKGTTFTFVQEDDRCKIVDSDGSGIFGWKAPYEVADVVTSEDKTVMLVKIMTAKGFYSGITRFRLTDNGWEKDVVMLGKHPDMKIRDRWVSDLGAVANDGKTALLEVGASDTDRSPERTSYRMFYYWETWDLEETRKIGTGLTMANSKKD
ncbi:hypothetical protein AAFN60_02970 [Roseibacillus persicicus]|nr:hypothetical protein [Roseibacillus persicicus]